MKDNHPYVILNVAITADGKTDTIARRGASISSPRDLERVDRLRASSDAVLVGGRTLLGDDPGLTVRSAALRAERRARGLDENPIKVGIVTKANLQISSRFVTAGPARILIFTTQQTSAEEIARLREHNVQVFVAGAERVDLQAVLEHLAGNGVGRLLVEGGGTLNLELLKQGLVDEVYTYIAPLIFGGATAPTFADGVGLTRAEAIRLELVGVETLDAGIVVHYTIPKH